MSAPKRFAVVTPQGSVDVTLEWPEKAAAYYYRFILRGQRHYRTTKERDPKKARAAAEDAARLALRAKDDTRAAMLLADAAEKYLLDAGDSNGHGLRLRRFAEFGKGRDLARLEEEAATHLVQRFLDTRAETVTPLTLRNERVCVSTFFSWLMRQRDPGGARLIPWRVNPAHARLLHTPKVPKKILPIVAPEALQKLLAAARPTGLYPVVVLMLSGFRPKGISQITWDKIDLGERPHASTTEKGHSRAIGLGQWAANELRTWKEAHPGKPASPSGDDSIVHKKLRMLREMADLPGTVTLQALRRTADFKLYQTGADPQSAAKILGHSVQTAMSHYVDYRQLNVEGAVNNLDFSPPKPADEKKSS